MKQIIVLVLACSITPLASAQAASCDLLADLMASAPSGFETHRGQPVGGSPNRSEANLDLQSHECTIEALGPAYSLACYSKTGTSLVASMGQRKEQEGIGACLPDWSKRRVQSADGVSGIEYGDSFTRETADAEIRVTAFVSRDDAVKSVYSKRHGFSVLWKPRPKPD